MGKKIYDVAILGAGVSGAFSAYKLSKYKDLKICVIEFGKPPGKRRKQLQGWLGCFPYSNARLYFDDYKKVGEKTGIRAASRALRYVKTILEEHGNLSPSKNKIPDENIIKKIKDNGFDFEINDYCQWKPENVHSLSRFIAESLEDKNVTFFFDNYVYDIDKKDGAFEIDTEKGIISAKKIILSVGRSGWRFARDVFDKFKIIKSNNISLFGFRGELPVNNMSGWNKSHCTVFNEDLKLGPFSWNGTVIPEDHYDLVISSWRSNEDRWRSEKVSFSVIAKKTFENKGIEQTERLGKLAYILSDNRVGKIRVKEYKSALSDLTLIPEYDWFQDTMKKVDGLIPGFYGKGYFYIPDIKTDIPNIKIGKNLSTEIDNLYISGESAGISGLLGAAISGCIAADNLI